MTNTTSLSLASDSRLRQELEYAEADLAECDALPSFLVHVLDRGALVRRVGAARFELVRRGLPVRSV